MPDRTIRTPIEDILHLSAGYGSISVCGCSVRKQGREVRRRYLAQWTGRRWRKAQAGRRTKVPGRWEGIRTWRRHLPNRVLSARTIRATKKISKVMTCLWISLLLLLCYASFYSSFWSPCRFPAFGAVVSPCGNGSFTRWILRFPYVETAVSLRRHCRFPACILLFPCVETSGFGSRSRSGTGCLLRQLRIKLSFVKQRYVILFIAFAG